MIEVRNRVLVAYDISDPERLRRVHGTMLGFGDPLQYSVFTCELSAKERVLLLSSLTEVMNSKEDRVLMVDLGPVGRSSESRLKLIGKPTDLSTRRPLVV